jgi:hypothetical protein
VRANGYAVAEEHTFRYPWILSFEGTTEEKAAVLIPTSDGEA